MQQHLATIFSIVKGEKVFQFMCGAATFDEVMEVLEQFKGDFVELKNKMEEEQKLKEQSPVEAEIVND